MENVDNMQKYITTSDKLRETIDKYGVAIIPSVITEEECVSMLDGIWSYFEHITQKWTLPLDRNNDATWREYYKLYPLHSMLVQHWNVGHAQVSWDLRQNPKIVDIFATLYNVTREELLVSFDGLSLNLPPEKTNKGWHRKAWYHTDQSYTNSKDFIVQSWITANDVNEGDATLEVLEGSHLYHHRFAKKFKITDKSDWYKLSEDELKYYQKKECSPVRIICKKGDMVFWSSKTIHCGVEAVKGRKNTNIRAIIYLCYLPRKGITEANLKKKKNTYVTLRTTSHNPHKNKMFAKNPRTYGGEVPEITIIDKPVLSELGLKLAGF